MAMAKLWIDPRDDAVRDLPRVCMICGVPATTTQMKRFTWTPPWSSWLLQKRQRVQVPLCGDHKNYWIKRRVVVTAGSAVLGLGCVVAMFSVGFMRKSKPNETDPVMAVVGLGFMALIAGWSAFVIAYNKRALHAVEITDRDIVVTNVSAEFVRVLGEEEDEYEREGVQRGRSSI